MATIQINYAEMSGFEAPRYIDADTLKDADFDVVSEVSWTEWVRRDDLAGTGEVARCRF